MKVGVLILILALASIFVLFFYNRDSIADPIDKTSTITFTSSNREHIFTLEVADTPTEREVGLMNRTSLPQDHGMLFVSDTPQRVSFWMKNTLIPLDLVLIRDSRIVEMIPNMLPCLPETECTTYTSNEVVDFGLELNAGTIERLDLQIGDNARLNNIP